MATHTGLEPVISSVTGWRFKPTKLMSHTKGAFLGDAPDTTAGTCTELCWYVPTLIPAFVAHETLC